MDLRMVKTRMQIKNAFMTLCQKLTPDKIKVKDICEVAMINKTTFYNHYTDSNQLSEEICANAVDTIFSDFPEKDKIFDDPRAYILGLLNSLERHASELRVIFRGSKDDLSARLESKLHSAYDGSVRGFEDGVRLSFAIGGFVGVVKDYIFSNEECNIRKLTEIAASILEAIAEKPGEVNEK